MSTSPPPLLEKDPPKHGFAGGVEPQQPKSTDAAQGNDAQHGEHAREIDLPPMGTGVVILMALILLGLFAALFLIGWYPHHRRVGQIEADATTKQNSKPIVNIAIPQRAKVLPAIELPGATRAFQSTAVYPRAAGYLKTLHVDIGDKVAAGQLLAEIETPEIDAQLAAANATIEQAKANATKAADDLTLAQTTLSRYQGFADTGGVTQQQLEEKRSAAEQARSAVAGADATVKVNAAEVQRLTALQGFQKVFAPFAGTITARGFDVGALLSATTGGTGGTPLFQIDQTDVLRIFVDVPQGFADQIRVGEKATFAVRGVQNQSFAGSIARTAGALDEQTRTLRVEADFPNGDGKLLPGMYGQVRYDLKQETPPLMIPSSALIFVAEGTRVAIVQPDNKIRYQQIGVGRDLGTELEVRTGLKGDERVVANPGERLTEGLEVTIATPASTQATAAPTAAPAPSAGATTAPTTREASPQ